VHSTAEWLLAEAPDLAERIVARWVGGAARFAGA
jgi:ATP-dependent DNA helicase RecG